MHKMALTFHDMKYIFIVDISQFGCAFRFSHGSSPHIWCCYQAFPMANTSVIYQTASHSMTRITFLANAAFMDSVHFEQIFQGWYY